MARTIRKRATKSNTFYVKYGKHRLDKWFNIYPRHRSGKNGRKLQGAYIRLHRTLVYKQLRMNEQLLIEQGLKSLTWNYVRGCGNKKRIGI
eukprot:UN04896